MGMNPPRKNNWNYIWKILTFSSRQVFEEVRPPNTPILLPAIFVLLTSSLLWLILYLIALFDPWDISVFGDTHPIFELSFGQFVLVFGSSVTLIFLGIVCTVVILGTYYFAIARHFQIDILWEHWFAFTCWTLVPMIVMPGARVFIDVYTISDSASLFIGIVVVMLFFIIPIVWTVSLTQQGLRIWTAKGRGYCLVFSVAPYVIYGLMAIPDFVRFVDRAVSQFNSG